MKKTILIVMVLVILSIGMVEGFLGEELVTCGDFSCDTDWSGDFGNGVDSWIISGGTLLTDSAIDIPYAYNATQNISIEIGRKYNIILDIKQNFASSLNVYLGGNISTFDSSGIKSYIITTFNTNNLTLEYNSNFIFDRMEINSISVKEIITIDEYEVVAMVNKNGVPIKEYETSIEPNKVNWVIKMIEKIFRVLK